MKKKISVALGVTIVGLTTLASCGQTVPTSVPTTEVPTSDSTTEVVTTSEVVTSTEDVTTTTEDEPAPELTPAEKILRNYIFTDDGAVVKSLDLPAVMTYAKKDYALTWTSDATNIVIATEESTVNKKQVYTTTITRPETGSVTVNLKVTLHYSETETATADFTVRVAALDVYDIADAFAFEQNKKTVFKSFDLPTTTELEGKTATISWASKSDILTIETNDGVSKAVFENQDTRKEVELTATFTYADKTATVPYKFTAYKERTPEELFKAFYDECGVYDEAFTIKGYVLAKSGFSTSNLNGYVYVLDQTLDGSYYAYRSYCSQEVFDSLKIGDRVQIEGMVATTYNGLYEAKGSKGQNLTVITDDEVLAPLTAAQLAEIKKGVNVEDVLYSENAETTAKYQTGNLVSLTNWTIKAVNDSLKAASGGTIVTLEKDGHELTVALNKYAIDLKTDAKAPTTADKIVSAVTGWAVGDVVSVTGILNYNNGWLIYACDDSTFTKDANLTKAKNALALKTAYVKNTTIDLATDFAVPTGYTVTAAIADADKVEYVKLEDNKLVFTPGENVEKVVISLTVSDSKGNKVVKTFNVSVGAVPATEQVAYEKEHVTITLVKPGTVTLTTVGTVYDDVTVTYAIVEAEGSDSATIDGNKLTVTSVDKDVTITVKATFTNGEVVDTKDIELKIANAAVTTYAKVDAVAEGTFALGIYNSQLNDYYFFTGAVSGNYLATSTNIEKAAAVTVKKVEGGYTLSFVNSSNKTMYITPVVSGSYVNLKLQETAYTFGYDTDLSTFTFTESEKERVMGTSAANSTYSTIVKADVTAAHYVVNLYTTAAAAKTREEKIALEKDALTLPSVIGGMTTKLPTAMYASDVKITYTVDANATIDEKTGYIKYNIASEDTTVTVTATLTCGGKTDTKEIKVVVKASNFQYSTQAITETTKVGEWVAIKGIVKSTGSNLVWITDGETDFEVYGNLDSSSPLLYGNMVVGKEITVIGRYQLYGSTKETYAGALILTQTDVTDAALKVKLTKDELALGDQADPVEGKALAATGTAYSDVTLTWSVKGGNTENISITDNKMTIVQPTDADVKVTVVCTVACGDATDTVEFEITIAKEGATKKKTMGIASEFKQYKKSASDTSPTENIASYYGLDPEIFDIHFEAGSSTDYIGARNTGTYGCTLYGSGTDGNHLVISIKEGYQIDKIEIYYNTGKTGGKVTINDGAESAAVATDHTYDAVDLAEKTSTVDIHNVTSSQIRITKIVITYTDLNFGKTE